MYVLIDLIGEILPLLILIGIPVLKGLNNSSKQKREYEEKRRKTTYNPPTKEEANVGSWRSIISEIEKEINRGKNKEKNKKKDTKKDESPRSTNKRPEVNQSPIHLRQYQEEMFQNTVQEDQIDGANVYNSLEEDLSASQSSQDTIKNDQGDMVFSSDPIIQGVIFSEILGPPKSRR